MFLLNNKNADIFDIPQESINQLHMNIEASLLSKFYDENLILDFKMDEKDVTYMHDILKSSDQTKEIALKLYNLYKHPEQIIYVFTAALTNNNDAFENFIAYTYCYNGNPENGSVSVSDIGIVKTISEVEENISSIIEYNIWEMEHDNPYGTVVSVEDDIIIFHPGKMNLKKNMTLMGFTEYFLTDKDNDGFTDKDAGLQKRIDDLKSALDYIENNKKDFNLKQTNSILKAYERYSGDSLSEIAQGYYTGAFSYKLKIISVADTIVVGKLIKRTTPWSKIRPGDKITLN